MSFTVADLARSAASRFGERSAICTEDGVMSYRELDRSTNRLANALIACLGSDARHLVGVLCEPCRFYAQLHIAVAKAGLTLVNLSTRATAAELAAVVNDADLSLLVYSPASVDVAAAVRDETGVTLVEISPQGMDALMSEASTVDPMVAVASEDIHSIVFTSGSTGTPKGVMISHRAAVARGIEKAMALGLGPDDGYALNLPMFHIGGDVPLYAMLVVGGRLGIINTTEPARLFDFIDAHHLTAITFPPATGVLKSYCEHLALTTPRQSSLRVAEGQADPVAPDVLSELTGRLGVRYRDSYGMSEVSTVLGRWVEPGEMPSYRKDPFVMTSLALKGSDGRFVDGPGSGELMVRSPMLTSGYLHRPEATAEAMGSGWFATGDLFDRDDSGGMRFLERAVYMIRSGGENIYPAELETLIRTAPGVAEAVVVAMPDERFGFVPKAYVVAAEGTSINIDTLSDFVGERVARFKRPRSWELIAADEVPRSPLGKVLRKELARRAMEPGT